jgi:hypothetical protein
VRSAHKARVGSEYQRNRFSGIGPRHEPCNIRRLDRDHGARLPPAARRPPPVRFRRRNRKPAAPLMLSAISLAARFSLSRSPRARAKRCSWPGIS